MLIGSSWYGWLLAEARECRKQINCLRLENQKQPKLRPAKSGRGNDRMGEPKSGQDIYG